MKFTIHFLLLSAFLGGLFPFNPAHAQASVEIVAQNADYLFNHWLHFTVKYESSLVLDEAFLFYQFAGSDRAWVYEGEINPDQTLNIEVALNGENQPTPFSDLEYWFRFASDHGDIIESPRYSLFYEDNRYSWQSLEEAPFTLMWHTGDHAFAQAILTAAQQGVLRAQQWLPLPAPQAVTLRAYSTSEDVQLIARQSGFAWQAGHTDLQAGLILLSLAPGPQQSLDIQRQVPHEIAHLMLAEGFGATYSQLPLWLSEGFASNMELYSDPLQAELLDLARAGDELIPFFSLCEAFPQDSASARLAYTQSASFVRYLFEKYNAVGFHLLVDAYANSDDCINAPYSDFGKDLINLEAEWRQESFSDDSLVSWLASFPWQPILVSATVALGIYLVLRFVRNRS